jgi:hypothetical protein
MNTKNKPIRNYRTVAKLIDFKEVDGKPYSRNLPKGKWRPSEPNPYGTLEIDEKNQRLRWISNERTV